MTGADPNKWVDLYHLDLKAAYRATEAAFEEIWKYKGWILRDEAAVPVLARVMEDPDAATDEELRLASSAVSPDADVLALTRDEMIATIRILPQHVGADTPTGRRLAQLQADLPDEALQEAGVIPDTGSYGPDGHSNMAVNEYLQAQMDAGNWTEVRRVLAAEAAGQNRKGIVVDGPAAKATEELNNG